MRQLSCTRAQSSYDSVAEILDGSRAANLASQLADFSRMQPDQPNPWMMVNLIFMKMISTAGAKEAELQGASSVVRGNALSLIPPVNEAMQGET